MASMQESQSDDNLVKCVDIDNDGISIHGLAVADSHARETGQHVDKITVAWSCPCSERNERYVRP